MRIRETSRGRKRSVYVEGKISSAVRALADKTMGSGCRCSLRGYDCESSLGIPFK